MAVGNTGGVGAVLTSNWRRWSYVAAAAGDGARVGVSVLLLAAEDLLPPTRRLAGQPAFPFDEGSYGPGCPSWRVGMSTPTLQAADADADPADRARWCVSAVVLLLLPALQHQLLRAGAC